jgi:hypothetical protein
VTIATLALFFLLGPKIMCSNRKYVNFLKFTSLEFQNDEIDSEIILFSFYFDGDQNDVSNLGT